MIFEPLYDSAQRRELMLVDGGMCHFHIRRDGQLTIREIISTQPGAGQRMLRRLMATKGATSLFAKCPVDLPANDWYARRGFVLEGVETTKRGRALKLWRLPLTSEARPNAGPLEVIFCAGNNADFMDIAIDAGLLPGVRDVDHVTHRPYLTDQDWKRPDFDRYEALLAEHRPHIATVLDWERRAQLDEVLRWAEMAARYVQIVVIIPKVIGGIAQLPHTVGGKPVRLGYSVPTQFAGPYDIERYNLIVPLSEFANWSGKGGVHLLGGSPQSQMHLYRRLGNVQSVDGNMILDRANACQFWAYPPIQGAKNRHFPQLQEAGGESYKWDANAEAFRRSCVNVMQAWRDMTTAPSEKPEGGEQMLLALSDEVEIVPAAARG
ncbi:MAG: DUF6610 family protein [Candidatus Paceibacterota bacterium]|jgi:hypothetical protein